MASVGKILRTPLQWKNVSYIKNYLPGNASKAKSFLLYGSMCAGSSFYLFYYWYKSDKTLLKTASAARISEVYPKEAEYAKEKLGNRECRFLSFASVKYNGVAYMTPNDFLESVTQDTPRHRKHRNVIEKSDVDSYISHTPSKWRSSTDFFGQLGEKGVLSYTEYLFLLCVLTKPHSGFQIAFNMFDTDMNHEVDKKEFLVLNRILTGNGRDTFSSADANKEEAQANDDDEDPEVLTTTLLTHFFGRHGREKLTYKEFSKFMDNLQTEVLKIEFTEYSKGKKTISESEFARILLRYTKVERDDYDIYISKIHSKRVCEKGISFEEFKKFFQFLNSLDDFTLAMKMYSLADRPISQQEFQQAVKACTGFQLDPYLVETVFTVFDVDGDGHLSYKEFVHIMKDRLSRGLAHSRNKSGLRWDAFRYCMSETMRDNA